MTRPTVRRPAAPAAPRGAGPGEPKPGQGTRGDRGGPVDATPLPAGFTLEFDQGTKQLGDGSLFGGSPARVLKLTAAGSAALAELRAGPVRSPAAATLARRLTDAGMAHPVPPQASAATDVPGAGAADVPGAGAARVPAAAAAGVPGAGAAGVPAAAAADVTVVVPVRDRALMLDRCLAAATQRYPVVVVDDGSADPDAIASVAARHGAILRRRDVNGGAGAARNTGLAGITTSLIAFLDSDCIPHGDWIGPLAAHFGDPLVGAVAPRIVMPPESAAAGSSAPRYSAPRYSAPRYSATGYSTPRYSAMRSALRYAAVRGSLDLGGSPARVQPGGRVSYVPTAALLVRREALATVARSDGSVAETFDPGMRYGEDVDLVWRLYEAGWRIRYDPAVRVPHDGPATWIGLLGRRFRYGMSAAPLARRHPANLAPLVLQPWPTVTVAALLTRRPVAAAAAATAGWLHLTDTVRRAGVPADGAGGATLTAVRQTWLGIGKYATQFATPALALGLARPGGRTPVRRWGRRAAVASLLLGPALTSYAERKPDLDPVRFTLGQIADDICYGAGVWAGCVRERTIVPVRPAVSWRMFRVSGPHRDRGGAPPDRSGAPSDRSSPSRDRIGPPGGGGKD